MVLAWITDRGWGSRGALAIVGAGVVASAWFAPLLARTGVEPTVVFTAMDNPELRRTGLRRQTDAEESGGLEAALRGSEHRR